MTTVLLIDDHELIRQGLAGAFTQADGFDVAGQAASVADGLAQAHELAPDVVVTDVRLPDGSGLDVVRALRKENKQIGLVVLTMYAGDEQLFAAMDAGASAFVGKDSPTSTVISAARQASVAPLTFACTGLAEAMIRRMSSSAPRLSDRERQVLDLLAEGLGVSAHRRSPLPQRVDREEPHRPDLRQAGRRQPGAGPGRRHASRPDLLHRPTGLTNAPSRYSDNSVVISNYPEITHKGQVVPTG